jgi:hypothetical protein
MFKCLCERSEAIFRLSQINHLEIATRLAALAMTLNQRFLNFL